MIDEVGILPDKGIPSDFVAFDPGPLEKTVSFNTPMVGKKTPLLTAR
jgi:hypothetical protein